MDVSMQSGLSSENQNRKKIIIVNNNMKIGGVQKALLDLLNEIASQYDVTLYLLNRTGDYLGRVPENVRVIGGDSPYRYWGMSQAESKKNVWDYLCRSFLALTARLFGRKLASLLINLGTKPLSGQYDTAISYMHDAGERMLYGGCNDFVLSKVNANNKVTFVHCDYESSGSHCKTNDALYTRFHYIAACSDGCKDAFLRILPQLEDKTKTVINCHNFDEIVSLADEDPIVYEKDCINAVTIARLSPEKGIERAIYALGYVLKRGIKVKLHIVGGGNQREPLQKLCEELKISDHVTFYGEQTNPYRYLRHADLLFISSYHEAAPLVIDEALCLKVPILSTETTSSKDMIVKRNCGWVCKNEQEDINRMLYEILTQEDEIAKKRESISKHITCDNRMALDMLRQVIG